MKFKRIKNRPAGTGQVCDFCFNLLSVVRTQRNEEASRNEQPLE